MKRFVIALACILATSFSVQSQILKTIKKGAERTVTNESSKKVNKKIRDAMNPKKKNKDKKEEKKEQKNNGKSGNEGASNEVNTKTPADGPNGATRPSYSSKPGGFTSGTLVIFEDYLLDEELGEFPSKWDLIRGTAENGKIEDRNVISYLHRGTSVTPLIESDDYLPEIFTVEFDVYFHLKGNEAYILDLGMYYKVDIRYYQASFMKSTNTYRNENKEPGWRHIALSFNKRALKFYVDGERILNVPNVKGKPTKFSVTALSPLATQGKPAMISNIRIAEGGVPLYKRLKTDGKIVTNDIHFEKGKATLKSESMKILSVIANLMEENADIKFSIEGHTDSDGSDEFNEKLSEERAASVKVALEGLGIDASRMTTKGFGETTPIATNDTPEGQAQNRRVEFVQTNQ